MTLFKLKSADGKTLPRWNGRYVDDSGKEKRVVLFTDKRASEQRLGQLQADADQRRAGVRTVAMDHASRPISDHAADYLSDLKSRGCNSDHLRISTWTLNKLIELGQLKTLSDLNVDRISAIVSELEDRKPAAASSTINKYITRAKAFARWLVQRQRLATFPLESLSKRDESKGLRPRARRALTRDEVSRLLSSCDPVRGFKYRFLILTGLRRNEASGLCWDQLKLKATIPFIQLRSCGKTRSECLPLHPDLVVEFSRWTAKMPTAKVFDNIPDVKTLKKDLENAGISFVTDSGRADLHALRHTFCTFVAMNEPNLKKAQQLTRHRDPKVLLNVYAHLGLSDSSPSLALISLDAPRENEMILTGTDDRIHARYMCGDLRPAVHDDARPCTSGDVIADVFKRDNRSENVGDFAQVLMSQGDNLPLGANADIVSETGPSTQVD